MELAKIGYAGDGSDMNMEWIELCQHFRSCKGGFRAITKSTGIRPRNATKRDADDMQS